MDSTCVITIDGPAGSGKSTLARALASALGWSFLDTGALYRAVAVGASERGIAGADPAELALFARDLDVSVSLESDASRVRLSGRDVTHLLRAPEISSLASRLSAFPGVRESLRAVQRRMGEGGRLVTEGRDQGTAVFPEARLKFFLTASPEARASRRARELWAKGRDDPLERVMGEMLARDREDTSREADPLLEPSGSVRVDSTSMTEREVLDLMLARAREAFGPL
jgi:cytidylate kinase